MSVTTPEHPMGPGDATHAVRLMADVSVWSAVDWRRMLDAAASGATVDGLLRPPTEYPKRSGDFLLLGPEVMTGDGAEQPQDVIMWRGAPYVRGAGTSGRTWLGEAHAAFDQAVTKAGNRQGFPTPDFWVARAAAAAAIAAAEQDRVANLIAWKQLRQSAPTSALPGGGDAIADEIETILGIATPTAAPVEPTFTPEELALILEGLSGIAGGDAGSYPAEDRALAERIALRLEGGS